MDSGPGRSLKAGAARRRRERGRREAHRGVRVVRDREDLPYLLRLADAVAYYFTKDRKRKIYRLRGTK